MRAEAHREEEAVNNERRDDGDADVPQKGGSRRKVRKPRLPLRPLVYDGTISRTRPALDHTVPPGVSGEAIPSVGTRMIEFPPEAFRKMDPAPDADFYRDPRFVTHIDAAAIEAVTELYRREIPKGADLLDLMSSWVSHLPPEAKYGTVVGHGLNAAELARNPRLTRSLVQDLNANPLLPFDDEAFDAVLCCVSVQYQQRPIEVWREALRVTRPGGRAIVTFSNRCFPTKAVALWNATGDEDHLALVAAYLREAGWTDVRAADRSPSRRSDPLLAVIGTKPGSCPKPSPHTER